MRRKEHPIELSKSHQEIAADKIRFYLEDNLEIEVGNLQARLFLDFITKEIGRYYYNHGVADSMSFVSEKTEELYLLMKEDGL